METFCEWNNLDLHSSMLFFSLSISGRVSSLLHLVAHLNISLLSSIAFYQYTAIYIYFLVDDFMGFQFWSIMKKTANEYSCIQFPV